MNIIVCLDDANGMMFNKRRQSKDRVVTEDILKMCGVQPLWVNTYSAKLFAEQEHDLCIDESFLSKALSGDFCFVENLSLAAHESDIEKIIVYKWNRKYPSDKKLDIDLGRWHLEDTTEFAGYSHEKITKEIYTNEN